DRGGRCGVHHRSVAPFPPNPGLQLGYLPSPPSETAPPYPPPILFIASLSARPMVALARQPGPSAPKLALISSSAAARPLTISRGVTFSSVVWTPRRLKTGSTIASTAAITSNRCSGRHPAITALTAIFSTVATPP